LARKRRSDIEGGGMAIDWVEIEHIRKDLSDAPMAFRRE
jgi:hypothetical protein